MKYILIFLLVFLCSIGYAQNPTNQFIGAPTTTVTSRGALKADSSLILPQFPDTTAANRSQYIKFYPGNLIRVFNDIYMRNTTATAWILISSGGGSNNFIDSLRKVGDSVFARKYGVFIYQYTDSAQKVLANNGISFSGDTLQVGGALNKNTTIDADGNNFAIYNSPSIGLSDGISGLNLKTTDGFEYRHQDGSYNAYIEAKADNNFSGKDTKVKIYTTDGNERSSIEVKLDTIKVKADNGNLYFENVNSNNDTTGSYALGWNPITKKVEAYTQGFESIDTTSLSNRINERVKYTDTAAMLAPYYKAADTVNLRRVTSVGLTMPSAFNVSNSPITTSGTIAVSGAGTASQYVRGDGALANFPAVGSGGGGTIYYLNGNTYQRQINGDSLFQMSTIVGGGAGRVFQRNGTGLLASFITDTLKPNQTILPAGVWLFNLYLQELGGGNNKAQIQVKLRKWNGTTLTTIDSSQIEEISNGSIKDLYTLSISLNQNYTLNPTDRIVLQFYIANNASNKTILFYTEDNNLASVTTTFPSGISSINGLSTSTQYFATGTSGTDFNISSSNDTHTFNLPTASATNRGALSSADWSTFNSKLGSSDTISLSNRINTKLNISDTSSMLNPYLRKIDTTNKYVTSVFRKTASDSVFFVRGGTNNFAFRDSTGGGGNIYTTDGSLTSARTLTLNSQPLTIAGTTSSRFFANGNVGIGTTTDAGFRLDVNGNSRINGDFRFLSGTTGSVPTSLQNTNQSMFLWNLSGGNGELDLVINSVVLGATGLRIYKYSNAGALTQIADLNSNTSAFNSGGSFDGSLTVGNNITATNGFLRGGFFNAEGNTQSVRTGVNGTQISWNRSGGSGEANYIALVQNTTPRAGDIEFAKYVNSGATYTSYGGWKGSGNFIVGSTTDVSSAILNAESTTKGFLQPRLTTTQMNAISTPATGLSVFNTTDSAEYVYRGSGATWQRNANQILNTASLNFPSTNAQNSSDLTITLTGAVDGDAVVLGVPNGAVNANSCYTAWVSASGVVTVRLNNYGTTAIDPAQATFKVTIIK